MSWMDPEVKIVLRKLDDVESQVFQGPSTHTDEIPVTLRPHGTGKGANSVHPWSKLTSFQCQDRRATVATLESAQGTESKEWTFHSPYGGPDVYVFKQDFHFSSVNNCREKVGTKQ